MKESVDEGVTAPYELTVLTAEELGLQSQDYQSSAQIITIFIALQHDLYYERGICTLIVQKRARQEDNCTQYMHLQLLTSPKATSRPNARVNSKHDEPNRFQGREDGIGLPEVMVILSIKVSVCV